MSRKPSRRQLLKALAAAAGGIGLGATALTLAGYYFLPGHFYIWMAFVGGGSLLGPGLYLKLRRR